MEINPRGATRGLKAPPLLGYILSLSGLQPMGPLESVSLVSPVEFSFFFLINYFNWRLITLQWASLVAQLVKNLPAMLETWVRSLGWEDALEK